MIWVQTQPTSQSTCGLEIQHGYSRLSDKISLLDKHVTIHTVPWPHALLFLLPPHISSSLWSVFLHVRPTAIPGCFFLFLWAEVSCSRPKLSSKSLSTSTYVRLFPSTVLFFFFRPPSCHSEVTLFGSDFTAALVSTHLLFCFYSVSCLKMSP